MKRLLFIFVLVAVILSACSPKVDPAENTGDATKPVVVKLWWTSKCPYCVEQILILQEIQTEIAPSWVGENVEIVPINPFDTPEEIVGFLQKNDITLAVASYPIPPIASGVPLIIVYVAGQDEPVATLVGLQSKEVILDVLQQTLDMLVLRGRLPPERI